MHEISLSVARMASGLAVLTKLFDEPPAPLRIPGVDRNLGPDDNRNPPTRWLAKYESQEVADQWVNAAIKDGWTVQE